MKKQYSNQDITVQWEPEKCIHSKLCWKGLIEVFNPKNKPWINMDGASTEAIIAQIQQCPSGALSYQQQQQSIGSNESNNTNIQILPNGPLLVQGSCTLQLADGTTIIVDGKAALCRCGASSNKPYCDGNHVATKFQG
jgi:uncharacterized Fe-S cluster protein YjdI